MTTTSKGFSVSGPESGSSEKKYSNYGLYSIRDNVAEEFGPVFVAKNLQVAIRNFRMTFKGNEGLFPEDYTLYVLAEFDSTSGVITALDEAKFILNGKEDSDGSKK